jgi:hypothetical protein
MPNTYYREIKMLTNLAKANQFGYWLSSSETDHAPGGNRLDIVLHEIPTSMEFGIRWINISVKSRDGTIEFLKIQHPWLDERTYQVCAGLIEIVGDKGEKFEAFTLGGSLQIDTQERFTACIVESPAPILVITGARPTGALFIDEIKILLAERRADRLTEPNSYDKRLINADPLELYISLINALIKKMDHSHHKDNSQIMQLRIYINAENKRLHEENISHLYLPRSIDDIL